MSGSSPNPYGNADLPENDLYRSTTLDEDNRKERQNFKNSLLDLQKSSHEKSVGSHYLGAQAVSSTGIPVVPQNTAKARGHWFNATSENPVPMPPSNLLADDNPTTEETDPTPTREHHVKNHKIATETKGRFEAFVDAIVAILPKKGKKEVI